MRTAVVLLLMLIAAHACAQKSLYMDEIMRAAEKGLQENPRIVEEWKKTTKPNVLWGYDATAYPVYLAGTLGFLYEQTGERRYAGEAVRLLATYGDLRSVLPPGYRNSRAEYADGVPALSNFFFLPVYARAYLRVRDSGVIDAQMRRKIETDLAGSVDFIFRFPEWGAHNRAILRAEALLSAALAMPDHPHAERWRRMAGVIAADNFRHWEAEDAANYHPVYFYALMSYATLAGRNDILTSPIMRYYMEYFTKQIAPMGSLPDYGDSGWYTPSGALRFVPIFEKAAALFRDPEMKWAAGTIFDGVRRRSPTLGIGEAYSLSDAYSWADESVQPRRPTSLSQEMLEDQIGKKIVFRNGWDSTSLYCMLNYRDEGDGGWLTREYLRQTISVEEEKMHHGHADENSIILLMNKGSLLLHDAGYRSSLPSGPYGAWRQDYFHNRIVARKNKRDPQQTILEFVRNSGAYRPVQTRKIDFLNLRDADMSRTRLVDDETGYQWDRTIIYVRKPGYFVVVDGIKVLRSDYYTFTSFWHAQRILSKGEHYFDIATDSLPGFTFPQTQSLLVFFPETYAKTEGSEPISRHGQTENAIYQTIASQYKAGDMETFVTLLVPHDRTEHAADLVRQFALLPTSAPYRAVAVTARHGDVAHVFGVRLDLDMGVARENIRPRYLFDLGKVRYGDVETDAYFFHGVTEKETFRYSATNFTRVLYRGKPLVEALPNTHGLQLDGAPPRTGFSMWRSWEDAVPAKQ